MSEENQVAIIKEKQLPIKLGITNAALTKLEKEYKEVPDATTPEGYALHKATKKKLTGLRTGVESERKLQVAEAVLHQRRVNKVANQITTRIVAIEEPWYKAKKAVDDALAEKKRQEAIKEQNRIEDIEALIADIRELTANLLGADVATIEHRLIAADRITITDQEYMEFTEQASAALGEVKDQLRSGVESAKVLAAQQKEIDDRQAAQDKHDRVREIKENIAAIKMVPVDLMGCTIGQMEEAVIKLSAVNVDDRYGDLIDLTKATIIESKAKLESMINQQKNLDDQQKILDEKQQKLDDDAAVEDQRKKDEKKKLDDKKAAKAKEAELLARMPEDIKVRTWMDNILAVEPPEVEDAKLCAIVRDGLLMLSDLNKMVYDGTQSPSDDD